MSTLKTIPDEPQIDDNTSKIAKEIKKIQLYTASKIYDEWRGGGRGKHHSTNKLCSGRYMLALPSWQNLIVGTRR